MGKVMPEPEYEFALDAEGELAVYALARISGEGADRTMVAGDISLSETEIRDILALNKNMISLSLCSMWAAWWIWNL